MPYYDALVLTLCINGFGVNRVLVDPRSTTNLLQLPAFIQMKLSSSMLNSIGQILSDFNGATTATLGGHTPSESQANHSAGFVFSRRGLRALQCHSGSNLAALYEGYTFYVPPNGKLSNNRWAG